MAADPQRWESTLQQSGKVTLSQSRGKTIGLLAVAVALAAAGIFMIADGSLVFGWLAVTFFGVLGIPVLGYMTLSPQSVTVTAEHISPKGAFDMPWSEVLEVFDFQAAGNTHSLALRLNEAGVQRVRSSNSRLTQIGTDVLTPLANQYTDNDVVETYTLPPSLAGPQQEMIDWLNSVRERAVAG